MIAIHGREKGEQDEIDLSTRLQAMADIVRKLWAQKLQNYGPVKGISAGWTGTKLAPRG